MGITPDISYRSRKHTLKTVGLAVVAGIRMQRCAETWRGQRKVHALLVQKLEGMRRRGVRGAGVASGAERGSGLR
jgi:hypothetical protein